MGVRRTNWCQAGLGAGAADLLGDVPASTVPAQLEQVLGIDPCEQVEQGATNPVHPVWWLAPNPAPLSPWKYS